MKTRSSFDNLALRKLKGVANKDLLGEIRLLQYFESMISKSAKTSLIFQAVSENLTNEKQIDCKSSPFQLLVNQNQLTHLQALANYWVFLNMK